MVCSTFDLFKIGVGPSSSHTMGPMTAACSFVEMLRDDGLLARTDRIEVDLYGSLALTGKGHATDRAVLLGLSGERPDRIDPDRALTEMGLDSLMAVELQTVISNDFGVEVALVELLEGATLRRLADAVRGSGAAPGPGPGSDG